MAFKNIDGIYEKLLGEGMKPGTPLNMPSHSVWVQDKDGWKLHSGRDGSVDFNRFRYMPKYKNAMLTENGKSPDDVIPGMSDYELFDSIYYPAWAMGRDNYLVGEEESIYDELNKYFDLPPFQRASKENGYEGNVFLVNPSNKTVSIKRGTQSIPLKRRK